MSSKLLSPSLTHDGSFSQLENSFVSAERVLDYMKTKPEAPWFVEGDVDPSWPQRGEVRFEEYSTRYKTDLDLVLRKVNLQLDAGEKVGIVGRTGAGKSSLTLALLRIIEAADGRILIDGVDISKWVETGDVSQTMYLEKKLQILINDYRVYLFHSSDSDLTRSARDWQSYHKIRFCSVAL